MRQISYRPKPGSRLWGVLLMFASMVLFGLAGAEHSLQTALTLLGVAVLAFGLTLFITGVKFDPPRDY
jgi:hypothetical protein